MTTRVLASPSLFHGSIEQALHAAGVRWSDACHVTATGSIATALRAQGTPAIPIATLLDLVTLPHWESTTAIADVSDFPGRAILAAANEKGFRDETERWRRSVSRLRFRLEFDLSRALRTYARDVLSWSEEARLLVSGRREFFRSIEALEASGFRPADLQAQSRFQQSALDAWEALISQVPNLSKTRELLWGFDRNMGIGSVNRALNQAFSHVDNRPVEHVLLHGFYFFTPPQWALFQLMDDGGEFEQIFLVHDDGEHPAFATWRQFFYNHEWRLPKPQRLHMPNYSPPQRAAALDRALSGQPLERRDMENVQVTRYRNVAEFAEEFLPTSGEARIYSPDHATIDNYALRLSRPGDNDAVDISDLPIGTYILNLHSLVDLRPGESPRVRLRESSLRDILSSGYLPATGVVEQVSLPSVLDRALPFFEGCDLGHEWVERALALSRLIRSDVTEFGVRTTAATDAERIASHAGNPLRAVPWADLTTDEADALHLSIDALVRAAREIADVERVEMGEYLGDLRQRLKAGMDHLSQAESQAVLSKLESAGDLNDELVSVDEVVEVVRLLLGRQVVGPQRPSDEDQGSEGEGGETRKVAPLRDLDVLAYFPSDGPLHLANLSDKSFPRSARAVGWPFSLSAIGGDLADHQRIAHQIMQAREWQSGLSDSYLLHLALCALKPSEDSAQSLRLSYVEQLSGRPLNLSPLVSLLVAPLQAHHDPELRAYLGGVTPGRAEPRARNDGALSVPAPVSRPSSSTEVLELDRRALATAIVCQRRFALQWVLGQTASYRARHHFTMIFGNVIGFLQWRGLDRSRARATCDDLWRFVTPGQRRSSEAKARVLGRNLTAWLATLGGSYTPEYGKAYDFAKGSGDVQVPLLSGGADLRVLPVGVHREEVCRHCPVKDRCLDSAILE